MSETLAHEVNFCFDGKVTTLLAYTAPPIGSRVQLARVDYRVISVDWTVDQRIGEKPTLRIIVGMELDR